MSTKLPELHRFRAPRVGDHGPWEGWLAVDNQEHIAAVLRELLVGKRFAFAEFNTGFSHMPLKINPQDRLVPNQHITPDDGIAILPSEVGQAHIVICHDTGTLGLTSQLETQPPFKDRTPEIERQIGWAPRIRIGDVGVWGGGPRGIQIQQKVPAGHLTNWTFAPHQELFDGE